MDFRRFNAESGCHSVDALVWIVDVLLSRQCWGRLAADSSNMSQCHRTALWMLEVVGTKIVEAPWTLIFRMGQ